MTIRIANYKCDCITVRGFSGDFRMGGICLDGGGIVRESFATQ